MFVRVVFMCVRACVQVFFFVQEATLPISTKAHAWRLLGRYLRLLPPHVAEAGLSASSSTDVSESAQPSGMLLVKYLLGKLAHLLWPSRTILKASPLAREVTVLLQVAHVLLLSLPVPDRLQNDGVPILSDNPVCRGFSRQHPRMRRKKRQQLQCPSLLQIIRLSGKTPWVYSLNRG